MEPKLLQHLRTHLTASVARLSEWLRTHGPGGLGRVRVHALNCLGRGAHMLRYPVRKALPRVQPVTGSVLIFGAIVAAGGYFAINDYATVRLQRELDRASNKISSILTKSIDRHLEIAKSAGALSSGPDTNMNRWTLV